MSFKTIKGHAIAEYEEKKSVFIGAVQRVENEEEAREFINNVKAQHRDARHNVYAYIIGENNGIQRYSDDGEPQGTGGIPVLEVLKRNGITNVVVVVTRYFGGVLLGASGLVRAYTKAASSAVKEASVVEKVTAALIKIRVEYDILGKIEYYFAKNKWQIEDMEYLDKVIITILSESEKVADIKEVLTEITSGRYELINEEKGIYFREGDTLIEFI